MREYLPLEIRGLRKSYTAGASRCRAVNNVLRGVDLTVLRGEVVVLAGQPYSGKSTLLLCAAGLMAADAGEIRWFGEASRVTARQCARYYHSAADVGRARVVSAPHVHVLDFLLTTANAAPIEEWTLERCASGDAVFMASNDEAPIGRPSLLADARVVMLHAGRLDVPTPPAARVAERMRSRSRLRLRRYQPSRFVDRPAGRV